ncbi:MAG: UbiA family prenyltransferase [Thaumarchaeota archaeon]|nr:UbiA family prenyltransferase [Nitrososphaerota archaeon]
MIKNYLQLVRVPGIFTVFTNILLGFLAVQKTNTDWFFLGPLLVASGFLFLAGTTLNDYFDYNIDARERPNRPLPSGAIPRKTALYLGLAFLAGANISSAIVGIQSLVLSLVITALVVSYNVKLKKIPVIGILNISSIRFLNVILGTTVVAFSVQVIWFAVPVAIFVAGISILAKTETMLSSKKTGSLNIIFIFITIIYIIVTTFNAGTAHYVFLVLFIIAVFVPHAIYNGRISKNVQKKVSFQLLAIISLDAVLISVLSNTSYAGLVLVLYIPAYLILNKMYLT